jgi:CDP-6-deoxy-D-xylo-4-hexulose-3-dehydrase
MVKDKMRIPYALSVHDEREINAVVEVLRQNKTGLGAKTKEFEGRVAELFGKKYGIMVNSGSSANLLAFELLDLSKGSEVITPALTFATTVAPIVQKGLTPVFIDVEPGTYLVNTEQLEDAITEKTEAMIIPSLIGNVPDMARLKEISEERDIWFIEDSCDTLGARFKGQPTGAFSDITTTSFYGSHIINCAGGGGMLLVDSTKMAERALVLRGWGRMSALLNESEDIEARFGTRISGVPYDAKFVFSEIGYNFLPLEISSAFGLVQLEKLKEFSQTRRRNFHRLMKFFGGYEEFFVLPRQTPGTETNWLGFPLTLKKGTPFSRMEFVIYLEKNGVQTRPIFTGNILRQPGFKNMHAEKADYPVADHVMESSIMVGCHQGLHDDHMNYLEDVLKGFLDKF